jgi:hypothetical protein
MNEEEGRIKVSPAVKNCPQGHPAGGADAVFPYSVLFVSKNSNNTKRGDVS